MTTEIKNIIAEEFKNGTKLLSLHHYAKDGDEVKLAIEKEWLPYLHDEVDLLSPESFHERHLIYMYTQELIEMLPKLKEEGAMEEQLLIVIETLLLALDYLTHERFAYAPFTSEHREEINGIIQECFSITKSNTFSSNANRPSLLKSKIIEGEESIYCLDEREEKKRLYMAVVYKKPKDLQDRFKQIAFWLGNVNLKPNSDRVSYQDSIEGKTNHDLHVDLLFYLNMVKQTLSWFIHSYSWRNNELAGFDEIDIISKLGLRFS
ncbi:MULTISPECIES: hypothetical protein [Bacillus]|uniref:Uncharacterized protein n=2 Tax=Bacillus thuringiensis TaxID=1428 RepID=A0AAP4Q8C5_BACTU|nr:MULTISPECIES: hypothetical protein [Bacillus]MEC0046363.1 hypothetical protein [Bacillus cereus]AFV21727.1 hypothetical protein BTB_502p04220 [Bacillus thuringiensis Bt407]EEM25244.1 hypothetical protein bthur0002_58860 [Bacillus thuringiensis Bt407]ERI01097.1 hypothetical protein BTCBT_002652 [Bacillus thuringiensis T01-328]MBN6707852.1 hypothetical protein [Bacillus thuringiensis]